MFNSQGHILGQVLSIWPLLGAEPTHRAESHKLANPTRLRFGRTVPFVCDQSFLLILFCKQTWGGMTTKNSGGLLADENSTPHRVHVKFS